LLGSFEAGAANANALTLRDVAFDYGPNGDGYAYVTSDASFNGSNYTNGIYKYEGPFSDPAAAPPQCQGARFLHVFAHCQAQL
jgi:hypothetical protein